ncbi:hypothetical protein A3G65_02330 [Candidatus Roizmanbacteria bacterium RIFCSPLOWO2_12_FULL_37_7b]|nr:MAG: hypothetical protein A3G65_02330 [Candidatus Roizmanbacteria bacterium RIFCSPLOWO2_12_FULL_37_7b]
MAHKYVVWFDEVDKNDIGLVGGKGANLGEMLHGNFPIPYGFVVTSQAYFYALDYNDLRKEIQNYISYINFDNPSELHDGAEAIRRLIHSAEVPKDLMNTIFHYYHHVAEREAKLYKKSGREQVFKHMRSAFKSPLVAVRSSATAEDLPDASFAGQQETFLNVEGEHNLIEKVKECWASLFTERATYYRHNQKFDHMKVGLAAVVQRMVQSQRSGIAFSIDPVTNDKSTITIEAIYGLGEYIVGGRVTPDHYEVSKKDFTIVNKEIAHQKIKLVKQGTENKELRVDSETGKKQKLKDNEIIKLAKLVAGIENHYYFPQDIEWAFEEGQMFIVQSRPITTLSKKNETSGQSDNLKKGDHKLLLTGSPASPGIGTGKPVIITSPDHIDKITQGDILVAPMTDPDYVPAMKKASAIVTELGGRTSHAAIVSRELGTPAVVGAEKATKILAKYHEITVNGSTGEIFEGKLELKDTNIKKNKHSYAKKLKTITKIYINLAQVDQAAQAAKLDADGIGLLRAEFMMADIGIHPKLIIKQNKQSQFIQTVANDLTKVVKAFSPRPVIYRATDFKSNEYKHLKGGKDYEPEEENPMLGFRGASRYIAWKDVFDMELEALKLVRKNGYKNIHLMIPFVRTPLEFIQIKSIIKEHGLDQSPTFKLWIMVEIPSTVILLDEFINLGIDGISIGTNDLTMLILGVDRDNHEVAHIYSEQNEAVLWALKRIVKKALRNNVTVSVCGQAPSDYPDLVEKLVDWGVTSLSINIDALERTRLLVHQAEKKLWHRLKK